MNARMGTILSLVGVLAAGSAAAMVNTRVLGSSAPAESASALFSVIGTSTPSAVTLAPVAVLTNVVGPAPSGPPQTSAPIPKVSETLPNLEVPVAGASVGTTVATKPVPSIASTTPLSNVANVDPKVSLYDVGEAGQISVQSLGGTLSITAVTPRAGWKVVESTSSTVNSPAKVRMSSSSMEITFSASLAGDNIITNVTSRSISAPTATVPEYDEPEDDEYEDDEPEDDEYEDDENEEDEYEDDDD